MKRISVIVLLLILFNCTCHAQRVNSQQNLELSSLDSLNHSLEKAHKLKRTGVFLSIAGPTTFIAGALLGAAAWSGGTALVWHFKSGFRILLLNVSANPSDQPILVLC